MPKVLLTGGAGYIASHTAKRLAANGLLPVTLDNLSSGHRWAVKWGPFIQGDIGDQDLLCEIVRQHRIEAVLHFAAYASVAADRSATEASRRPTGAGCARSVMVCLMLIVGRIGRQPE